MNDDNPRKLEGLFENNRRWAQSISTSDPGFFAKLPPSKAPNTCGSAAPTAGCPRTRSWTCCRAKFLFIATSPIWSCTPISTASPFCNTRSMCSRSSTSSSWGTMVCGGVRAAYENADNGLIDNWLRNIKDVLHRSRARINAPQTSRPG